MDEKKCQRGCNMTSSEKVLLADLVVKYSGKQKNGRHFGAAESQLLVTVRVFCLCAGNTAKIVN